MMKARKLLAVLLSLAMVTSFAACSTTESNPENSDDSGTTTSAPANNDDNSGDNNNDDNSGNTSDGTLVVSTEQGLEAKFSPFFASSAADNDIVDMVSLYCLTTDRVGDPILNAIEGETRSYNGTDYTYTGPANVSIEENADGSVSYTLKIRDDLKFSDGTPADIDDVIFGLYVYFDPVYDGSTTISSYPILGLKDYLKNNSTLSALLAELGRDNTDFTYVTEEQQTAFWDAFDNGLVPFTQEIVDYIAAATDTPDIAVADAAPMWGFELEDGATIQDFAMLIGDSYGWNFTAMEVETAGSALADLISADVYAYASTNVQTGDSADYVSGVERIDDYTLKITTSEYQAPFIYQLSLPIVPLHYYGDESAYDYDAHKFGFEKGDLSGIKSHNTKPLGAGPYMFSNYSNGTVYMDANPNYYKGQPKIAHLNFLETTEAQKINGVVAGTIDIADPSYSLDAAAQITDENGGNETTDASGKIVTGDILTTYLIDYRGYGYIGITAAQVNVNGEAGSEASKNLRKALATVLASFREETVDSYYGSTASVINYPISNTNWAAPQVTDDGYQVAYSKDVNGNDIFTSGMSRDERIQATLNAALGYFEAAGFTVTDGKVTASPDGQDLSFKVAIGGGGQGDHPTFLLLSNAAEALSTIGIELVINDITDTNQLYGSFDVDEYDKQTTDMWCAAWQATPDPDMYQLYHSKGNTNHYRVYDDELDELIMLGRTSFDNEYRKGIYKDAMEIILDWGVEVPVYQRSNCTLMSSERVNTSTVPADLTPFYGWGAEIQTLELN